MENEVWKPIPGLPGYSASTLGDIRKDATGRLVAQTLMARGYLTVAFRVDGKYIRQLAHRVIARAFIGYPVHGREVNHLNGIKTDNRPSNLEYVTRLQNQRHAIHTGLCLGKLTDEDVAALRECATRLGGSRAARLFGVSKAHVCKIMKGERRKNPA